MRFKRKKHNKKKLVIIIIFELLLAALFCYMIFCISWQHITERRTAEIKESFGRFESDTISEAGDSSAKTAFESVKEVVDEKVWTTEEANYRTGPDKSYEKIGTLYKYASMIRTGITYNDWSQVTIDDETYYIKSKYLTTESPIVLDGGTKGQYEAYAMSLFSQYGWADTEIFPLIKLWNRESGWNPNSHNKSSGAHGIPQAFPAKKMAAYGSDYYTNGYTQIRWGLNYIYTRYGSPSRAWSKLSSSGWY